MLRIVELGEPDHRRDVADTAVQHRRVRRFQRHIGAAAHGDTDVGRGQRRRVVDAVTDLGDVEAFAPSVRATMRCLSSGRSSARTSMPNWSADRFGRAAVVAGQHDDRGGRRP